MTSQKPETTPNSTPPASKQTRREMVRKIVIGTPAILLTTGRSAYAQGGSSTGYAEYDDTP